VRRLGCFASSAVILALCFLLVSSSAALAESPVSEPLKFDVFLASSGSEGTVVVTLVNSSSQTVNDVTVEFWLAGRLRDRKGYYVVSSGSSRVVTFTDARSTPGGYVLVRFSAGRVDNSEASPVPALLQTSPDLQELTTLGAAVLSLIGVLLGAFLGHFLTAKRELARSKFDWRKMVYERYEEAYVSFLSGWASSTNVRVLEEQFELLMSKAPVPAGVIRVYRDVRTKLADTGSTSEEKRSAADLLYGRVGDFMTAPWRQRKG
jgi:hypothetical protein